MTLDETKSLKRGDIVTWSYGANIDEEWKVSRKPKLWKRHPERVYVALRRGRDMISQITEVSAPTFKLKEEKCV